MLTFSWWIVGEWSAAVTMILVAVVGLRLARKLPGLAFRILARIASAVLGLVGSLLASLMLAFSGCRSHSEPIYSNSGTMAVRIDNADEGATGGETSVELFWAHWLGQKTVFVGPLGSVEATDIQWEGDSKLSIHYMDSFSGNSYHCVTQAVISVTCSPRPR
jgi:hypothetical protein